MNVFNQKLKLPLTSSTFKNQVLQLYRRSHVSSMQHLKRDFLTLKDYTGNEVKEFLSLASEFKHKVLIENKKFDILKGKNVALIFEKKSTRTRISMETGGHGLFLSPADIHLGEGESLVDTAKVMSKLVDAIFGRVYEHSTLDIIAREASVPVIKYVDIVGPIPFQICGLSELYHPLQSLADFLTLYEHFQSLSGLQVAWVGDGNNIIHSLMMTAPKLGVDLKIATPKGYEVVQHIQEYANLLAKENGTRIDYTNKPEEAILNSNVIVTDTWVSMGQEDEYNKRVKDFAGFQITNEICRGAADNWVFLHCLPRKQHEVHDEVFYSNRSLVWNEAGNRKWTAMAVMARLLSDYDLDLKYSIV